jgi:Protein of unknown function (DUF4232)
MDRSPADRILEEWNAVTNQARRPDSAPRRSTVRGGLAGAGLAGASLLVIGALIAVVWLGRPGSGPTGDVGGQPSSSPSATPVATPSPSPSPSPTPSATPVATPTPRPTPTAQPTREAAASCAPTALAARITMWEGAAGSRIAHVEVTNTGPVGCTLATMDQPQLIDGKGSVLIDGTASGTSPTLTIAPGGVLKTLVRASNYCGPDPLPPTTVAFVIKNGRFEATPVSPTDATVPPCNGDPGSAGSIDMQPWAR